MLKRIKMRLAAIAGKRGHGTDRAAQIARIMENERILSELEKLIRSENPSKDALDALRELRPFGIQDNELVSVD